MADLGAHGKGPGPFSIWDSYKSAPAAVSILYALPTYFRAPRAMVVRWSLRRPQPDIPTRISRIFVLRRLSMLDIILIAAGLGFFALSIAYAYGCDRL